MFLRRVKSLRLEPLFLSIGTGGAENAPFKNICETNQSFLNDCGTGILPHGQPKAKEYLLEMGPTL